MILGFKRQFRPFVEDGSKRHTIRKGKRWRVGMRADLYVDPRQKTMSLMFRARVWKVQSIRIGVQMPLPFPEFEGLRGQIIHWDYDSRHQVKPVKPRKPRKQRKTTR